MRGIGQRVVVALAIGVALADAARVHVAEALSYRRRAGVS